MGLPLAGDVRDVDVRPLVADAAHRVDVEGEGQALAPRMVGYQGDHGAGAVGQGAARGFGEGGGGCVGRGASRRSCCMAAVRLARLWRPRLAVTVACVWPLG